MTTGQRAWAIRLASIAPILYLPLACTTVAVWIFGWPKGDNFPTAIFAGFGAALIAMFPLARWTTFAPVRRIRRAGWTVIGVFAFDVITFSFAQFFPGYAD